MRKRKIAKVFAGMIAAGMVLSMPGITNLVYAETGSGSVEINEENFPDEIFRTYVSESFDKDNNGVLSSTELEVATIISVSDTGVMSLEGIEYFTDLLYLFCDNNNIKNLDVSNNSKLGELQCYNNKLVTLNVSNNPNLRYLFCKDNRLSNLDVSSSGKLKSLVCDGNRLSYLDVSNNPELAYFTCSNNKCALYYDEDRKIDLSFVLGFDTTKMSDISGATLSDSELTVEEKCCKVTYIYDCGNGMSGEFTIYTSLQNENEIDINIDDFPDDVFRENVSDFDYDNNGQLSKAEIASVDIIDITQNGIQSLKGIEYFTELKELYCGGNQLSDLNVKNNGKLRILQCWGNQLTSLDMSDNTELYNLECFNNLLSDIDICKNGKLECLNCDRNKLTSLDISSSTIRELSCCDNQLRSLNVTNASKLECLSCNRNQLIALDLSTNRELENFECKENQLMNIQLNEQYQIQLESVDNRKISNLQGGTMEGNIFTANEKEITYTYDCGNGYTMDVTLSCKFPGYIVRFDSNGATSGIMSDMTNCPYNNKTVLIPNQYKKDGYIFTGWNTSADGSGTGLADGATINYGDDKYVIVLYAQWEKVVDSEVEFPADSNPEDSNPEDSTSGDSGTEDPTSTTPEDTKPTTPENGWYTDENGTKFFYKDGMSLISQWHLDGEKWYYLTLSGAMVTGWQDIGGKSYYFYSDGSMAENTWVDGYYVGTSGAWVSNPVPEGWQKSGNRWWYQYADGTYAANTWKKIDGLWYYFDASGWMTTGWTNDGQDWYYMNEDGTMKTGWLKDGNTWYYLRPSGAMATNWVKEGGSWYLMDESGAMKTGWAQQGEDWYYLNESGVMQTGWVDDSGTWYYLDESGVMAHDTVIDGYALNADGAWVQ